MKDPITESIASYVCGPDTASDEAYQTARLCLADSLGCALLALNFPACTNLLGPIVPGTTVPQGCRIPGTEYVLDPVQGAFNIGMMIRWLDYNDTWLAAEWGHPSDNLGALLAVGQMREGFTVQELFRAMIQAYEIQGVLALTNSFNAIGIDHVALVRVASAAVSTRLLGGDQEQVFDAISNAWIDGGPLRTYRHAPNTGSRKSWAAGDATSRGVWLAHMTLRGEMGYPSALNAPRWGLEDVLFDGKSITLQQPLGSYVMENILFKVAFPAEFHAQTAVEAAIQLHPQVKERLDKITSITIKTQKPAIDIIDKKGPLNNPADRDHCLQYMTAIGLIFGELTAEHYEEETAKDPRIDALRDKMDVIEDKSYSCDYLDPKKRSIANALTISFEDGSRLGPLVVEYPIGHKRRREEALPLLFKKCESNLKTQLETDKVEKLLALFQDHDRLCQMHVSELIDKMV